MKINAPSRAIYSWRPLAAFSPGDIVCEEENGVPLFASPYIVLEDRFIANLVSGHVAEFRDVTTRWVLVDATLSVGKVIE